MKYGIRSLANGQWLKQKPSSHKGRLSGIWWSEERHHPFLSMSEAETCLRKLPKGEKYQIVSEYGIVDKLPG